MMSIFPSLQGPSGTGGFNNKQGNRDHLPLVLAHEVKRTRLPFKKVISCRRNGPSFIKGKEVEGLY